MTHITPTPSELKTYQFDLENDYILTPEIMQERIDRCYTLPQSNERDKMILDLMDAKQKACANQIA